MDEHSEEFRDAIPDEYREKVEKLQEHRPWEDGEEEQDVDDTGTTTESTGESDTLESVDAIEDLEAEVEAEAEALLDEIQTEYDD